MIYHFIPIMAISATRKLGYDSPWMQVTPKDKALTERDRVSGALMFFI
jgi:hypothetical protein